MATSRAQRETLALVKTHQIGFIVDKLNGKKCAITTAQGGGIKERLYEERMRSQNPKWPTTPLREAIRTNGAENFEAIVIGTTIDKNAALMWKQKLIDDGNLKNPAFGYNQR
jgi:hypothetical protein